MTCDVKGSKIRSKGKGRGLGIGDGKGPIGVPYRNKEVKVLSSEDLILYEVSE